MTVSSSVVCICASSELTVAGNVTERAGVFVSGSRIFVLSRVYIPCTRAFAYRDFSANHATVNKTTTIVGRGWASDHGNVGSRRGYKSGRKWQNLDGGWSAKLSDVHEASIFVSRFQSEKINRGGTVEGRKRSVRDRMGRRGEMRQERGETAVQRWNVQDDRQGRKQRCDESKREGAKRKREGLSVLSLRCFCVECLAAFLFPPLRHFAASQEEDIAINLPHGYPHCFASTSQLSWPTLARHQAKWDIEPLDAHPRKTTRGPYRETQVPSVVFVLVTVVVVVVVESTLSSNAVRYSTQRPRYGTSRSFSYISCWHTWIELGFKKRELTQPSSCLASRSGIFEDELDIYVSLETRAALENFDLRSTIHATD